MASNNHRKRGGTFHLDEDTNDDTGHDVQFATPYYDESQMPEPLDLSKLCLDDDLFEKDDEADADFEAERDRVIETRGRSRSRSVHENDLGAAGYVPTAESLGTSAGSGDNSGSGGGQNKKGNNPPSGNGNDEKGARKGGPLQQREVQALKKGLEEANQSLNRTHNREDDDDKIAAENEKRNRLLANNMAANTSAEATRRVKLLMLGDSGVGKSSLIMRWTLDSFSPSLQSTVGVNFKSRKVHVANELVQVQVWDTAGQEQFHKITTSYYKGAQGIMLVYDVTDRASLANIEYWIKNIKNHASDQVQVALIGNKTDLRSANTDPTKKFCETERGKEIAVKYGIPFFETSAKDSFNVEIAFLTLVEHIALGGSGSTNSSSAGGATTHSPGSGNTAGGSSQGSTSTSSSSSSDRKSIVEKAEKPRFLGGVFKSKSFNGKAPAAVPSPTNGSSPAAAATGAGASGQQQPIGGDGGAEGDDKEKCIIS